MACEWFWARVVPEKVIRAPACGVRILERMVGVWRGVWVRSTWIVGGCWLVVIGTAVLRCSMILGWSSLSMIDLRICDSYQYIYSRLT